MAPIRSETERLRRLDVRSSLRGRAWPGVALIVTTAAVVTGKNLVIAGRLDAVDHGPWLLGRNAVWVGVTGLVVVTAVRSRDWLLGAGLPRSGAIDIWATGLGAVGAAGAAVAVAHRPAWAWPLIGIGAVLLSATWRRARAHGATHVTWAVAPGCVTLVVVAIARTFWIGPRIDLLALGTVVLATGVFEEGVFRGGLQSLAIRTGNRIVRLLVPGVAFGAWHIMDAVGDVRVGNWDPAFNVGFVAGTVVVTALASWLVLEPLRLRSRSIVGPALLHGAVNAGLLAVGAQRALG